MPRLATPAAPPHILKLTRDLTLVVCPDTGRRFIGIELSAVNFDPLVRGLREALAILDQDPKSETRSRT
jgi:hypothetical protein